MGTRVAGPEWARGRVEDSEISKEEMGLGGTKVMQGHVATVRNFVLL